MTHKIPDLLHIKPATDPVVCAYVKMIHKKVGLWSRLCHGSLWQGPTHARIPVHDEDSALRGILNALPPHQAGLRDLA